MNDPYENLANAIVLQAVKDYRDALKKLKINSNNRSALYWKHDVERFFRSNWYSYLTSIDSEWLINKLKEEVQ